MIKLFALGNEFLGDDGIAIKVIRHIEKIIKDKILIFYSGLDDMICLENITENDTVIFIDSTFFNETPGTVNFFTKEYIINHLPNNTIQNTSLSLSIYSYTNITVYFIGIEIASLYYSYNISEELNNNFKTICDNVLEKLIYIINKW